MRVVVDTNVPIAANANQSPQISAKCTSACAAKLQEIKDEHILVLDDGWRILKEYMNKLHSSGQPGVGDGFLKWALTCQANPQCCELVHITLKTGGEDDNNDFEEFPDDPALAQFDRSDRKFVAVALAHPESPPILNATDTDWWEHQEALTKNGIRIDFLCPDAMP